VIALSSVSGPPARPAIARKDGVKNNNNKKKSPNETFPVADVTVWRVYTYIYGRADGTPRRDNNEQLFCAYIILYTYYTSTIN